MSNNKSKTGPLGEEIVLKYLKSKGFLIITQNFTIYRVGEIDIIATKDGVLHFVEVKTSEYTDVYSEKHSLKHFDRNKKDRIIKVMQRYCFTRNISIPRCVDIAAVSVSRETKKAKIAYYSNVYMDSI